MTAKTPSKSIAGSASTTSPQVKKTVKQGIIERLLDPMSRLIEGIYTVLIVLTFTLAARAIRSYSGEIDLPDWNLAWELFVAAGGCAVAWGMIDGIMYVLTCAFERGKDRRLYQVIRNASSVDEGVDALAEELDDELEPLMSEAERRQMYVGLYERLRTSAPPQTGLESGDFAGALGTFLVAVTAALPVLLPLLLPGSIEFRVRASNTVAFAMLFIMGFRWAQYSGGKPWLVGTMLLIVGALMVVVAIPLGG